MAKAEPRTPSTEHVVAGSVEAAPAGGREGAANSPRWRTQTSPGRPFPGHLLVCRAWVMWGGRTLRRSLFWEETQRDGGGFSYL